LRAEGRGSRSGKVLRTGLSAAHAKKLRDV
jgi:hypothetical protein